MRRFFAILAIASFANVQVWADAGGTALPQRPTDNGDVAFSNNAAPTFNFTVNLIATCFPVNVRNVPNPLAPTSTVTMTLPLLTNAANATGNANVVVSFPAALAIGQAKVQTIPAQITGVTGANPTAQIAGNTMMIKVPGVVKGAGAPFALDPNNPVQFVQKVPPGYGDPSLPANYVGTNGPLTRSLSTSAASDGSSITLNVAFPGAIIPGTQHLQVTGLCGSMYSPLMVFFNHKRPSLNAVSSFPLRPEGEKFFWPEGSKNWAFLVYDGKNDGKIDSPEQLFGSLHTKNGFEALRRFDENKDGKIDKKDPEFAHIKLWYDLNGNGKVDKGELKSLASAKIDSLSLDYKSDRMMPIGQRGQFREYGYATAGKKKFDVIDVWFGVSKMRTDFKPAKKEKGEGTPNVKRQKKT